MKKWLRVREDAVWRKFRVILNLNCVYGDRAIEIRTLRTALGPNQDAHTQGLRYVCRRTRFKALIGRKARLIEVDFESRSVSNVSWKKASY